MDFAEALKAAASDKVSKDNRYDVSIKLEITPVHNKDREYTGPTRVIELPVGRLDYQALVVTESLLIEVESRLNQLAKARITA